MSEIAVPRFEARRHATGEYRPYIVGDWPEHTRISQELLFLHADELPEAPIQILNAEPPIVRLRCENGSAVYRLSNPRDGIWDAELVAHGSSGVVAITPP